MTRTEQLLAEIARTGSTRDSIAAVRRTQMTYSLVRHNEDFVDWPTVNKALRKRYTVSGLHYIKTQAWKR